MDFKLLFYKKDGSFLFTNRIDWWKESARISAQEWIYEECDIQSLMQTKSVSISIDNFRSTNVEDLSLLRKILTADIKELGIVETVIGSDILPKEIEQLIIGNNVKIDIDASQFENLTYLNLLSYKSLRANIENYFPKLEEVVVWHYNRKGYSDFNGLLFAKNAVTVQLIHTNVDSLMGLEQFSNLNSLEINMGKSLEDISSLFSVPQIKHVILENCKKIKKIMDINRSISIDRILFLKCGVIPYFKAEGVKVLDLYQTKME